MELKQTSLYQKHIQHKGRIVDFSGWALPVEYSSTLAEAKAVRERCGIFDASHMGEIAIKGKNALAFLQYLTPNDISLIQKGQMQYNLLLNPEGGVIDDLMVYHLGDSFICVANASNKDKVLAWLNKNKKEGVKIEDQSDKTALIAVQGPQAAAVVSKVVGEAMNLDYMHFVKATFKGKEAIISRSGYTGTDGFEIYPSWDDACLWWDAFMSAGKGLGLVPCGLGARDVLRIEVGYPLYGHEINDTTNPYQASLAWVVKPQKDFIAKDKLMIIKKEGPAQKRVGFIMQQRGVPRQDYPIYAKTKKIGRVTSGTFSPNANQFIGMAYVDRDYTAAGTEIEIEIRDRLYKAKVAKWPFVEIGTKGHNHNAFIKKEA
ncbi:MAG: glycine cleavage system aminomethyltransferase GcvT [Candidatus Omnitrophota bacterium]|nr:MAG: glycine cleavage system aminomethyltransferase GcvT [Candidatus Omnitrophota bacterium]